MLRYSRFILQISSIRIPQPIHGRHSTAFLNIYFYNCHMEPKLLATFRFRTQIPILLLSTVFTGDTLRCPHLMSCYPFHWRRNRGGARGHAPPTFQRGGGGQRYVCAPPHFQTQNLGLGIEPTDICDVTLAWLASRCCPADVPPTFCHVPTPLPLVPGGYIVRRPSNVNGEYSCTATRCERCKHWCK